MDLRFISQGIRAYKKKEYAVALGLFEQAAIFFGLRTVQANIYLCRKALNLSGHSTSLLKKINPKNIDLLENEIFILKKDGFFNLKSSQSSLELTLPDGPNDFSWLANQRVKINQKPTILNAGLSIIVPTFNRAQILDKTLSCLALQKTQFLYEVIVSDDGSSQSIIDVVKKYEHLLDIKYVWQPDRGYRLSAVRNLGIGLAKYDFIGFLDCDMAPNKFWVESFVSELLVDDDVALIGSRKYIDTLHVTSDDFLNSSVSLNDFPEVITNNSVAGRIKNSKSIDWRLEHFAKTENLRLCNKPFQYFSGGNVVFSKKWIKVIGLFDEDFNQWGGEDNEFAYRLFRSGCFFKMIEAGVAYHQEPPNSINETDRKSGKEYTKKLVMQKVAYLNRLPSIGNKDKTLYEVPLISIFIVLNSYDCIKKNLVSDLINSILSQAITDLEIILIIPNEENLLKDELIDLYQRMPNIRICTKNVYDNKYLNLSESLEMAKGFYVAWIFDFFNFNNDTIKTCLDELIKDQRLSYLSINTELKISVENLAFPVDGNHSPKFHISSLRHINILRLLKTNDIHAHNWWNHLNYIGVSKELRMN